MTILHDALALEQPLIDAKSLSWALVLMADGMDDKQASDAFNVIAIQLHRHVGDLTEKWEALTSQLQEPEISAPVVLQLVHPLEA